MESKYIHSFCKFEKSKTETGSVTGTNKTPRSNTLSTMVKRKSAFVDYLTDKCGSVKSGQTIMSVVVLKKMEPRDAANPRSPIGLMVYALGDASIKYKKTTGSDPVADYNDAIGGDSDGGDAKRVKTEADTHATINSGDVIYVANFDRTNAARIKAGIRVKITISADLYKGKPSYKCNAVTIDSAESDILDIAIYNKYIVDTSMAKLPVLANFGDRDSTNFCLPLSNDSSVFSEVDVVVDDDNEDNLQYAKDNIKTIGITTLSDGKPSNFFGVVYTNGDRKVMLKLNYEKSIWNEFGIYNLDSWKKVIPRMLYNAKECLIYGFSTRDGIQSMVTNITDEGEVDEDAMQFTCGYTSRLGINLAKTVVAAGVELGFQYVNEHFGAESDFKFDKHSDVLDHEMQPVKTSAINQSAKNKIKSGIMGSVVNITELQEDFSPAVFKAIADVNNVKFYGIFETTEDRPYEYTGDAPIEEFLVEQSIKPVTIFAVAL